MKSIELNWIRRKCDKSIPIPEVVFHPLSTAFGYYYSPENNKELYDIDGKPYSMRYGVLVIDPYRDNIESTLVHEWRHHWQHFHGIKFEISQEKYSDNITYEQECKEYIDFHKNSKTELDALRFEYKYSTDFNSYQEELLFSLIGDIKPKKTITYKNEKVGKDYSKYAKYFKLCR